MELLETIIFKTVPVNLFLILRNVGTTRLSELYKKLGTTYAHTYKLVRRLENLGIVETYKDRRDRRVFLTVEGRNIAEKIYELSEIIGVEDNHVQSDRDKHRGKTL